MVVVTLIVVVTIKQVIVVINECTTNHGGCLKVPVPERSALVKKRGLISKGKRPL